LCCVWNPIPDIDIRIINRFGGDWEMLNSLGPRPDEKVFPSHQTKTFVIWSSSSSYCLPTLPASRIKKRRQKAMRRRREQKVFYFDKLYEASINFTTICLTCFGLFISNLTHAYCYGSPSESDLVFHFFGVESDSLRVREAINKMVEKGRIGNFSLVSTHYSLHQEPGLVLQVRAIRCTHLHPGGFAHVEWIIANINVAGALH
jgi:hypothetical protein